MRVLAACAIALCAFAVVTSAIAAEKTTDKPAMKMPAKSDKALIAEAMSAAPPAISRDATIVAMNADGSVRTLRKGTNGWTCVPDDPGTPGVDPMCTDPNAWEWAQAYLAHKPPPDKVGFIYMLRGGSDASNTDPYATAPSKGMPWVTTGPHVMMVGPGVKNLPGYATGAQPDTSKPYVMFGGTPYEHLMIPVK
jgi:hypothetical protein